MCRLVTLGLKHSDTFLARNPNSKQTIFQQGCIANDIMIIDQTTPFLIQNRDWSHQIYDRSHQIYDRSNQIHRTSDQMNKIPDQNS